MPEGSANWTWRSTATAAVARHDDIWFFDENVGWAVNSNGHVIKTEDGGKQWDRKFSVAGDGVWLRCLGFANRQRGWVGTTTTGKQLYETSDGGENWDQVVNLPAAAPSAVCGLFVASDHVIYAAGTNWPDRPTSIIKSDDGGATWSAKPMNDQAAILVDIYFRNEREGWVVGGKSGVANPTREDVEGIVLFTNDGGASWRETRMLSPMPNGEWGWKIFFVTDQVAYVALQNFTDGAVLKTVDGGQSWTRKHINDPQENRNLEGIGFIDETTGWVGGWHLSSASEDGGENWRDANEVGRHINRFRFIGNPVRAGYASGSQVYCYGPDAAAMAEATPLASRLLRTDTPTRSGRPLTIGILVPKGAGQLKVHIWDSFSAHICKLTDEAQPKSGPREIKWDCCSETGETVADDLYCYRVVVDDESESRIVKIGEG